MAYVTEWLGTCATPQAHLRVRALTLEHARVCMCAGRHAG